jgi:cytidylate kinase
MASIIISDELKHRISSVLENEKEEFKEVFKPIFDLEIDEENKEYRNYFGIARDNYNMISFLDKKKIDILRVTLHLN